MHGASIDRSVSDTSVSGTSVSGTGAPARLVGQHYVILALIILLLTVDGVDMQLLSVTVSAISTDWGLPLSAFSTAMAAGHLGATFGATLGGSLADRIGRRTTILIGVVWFGTFTLATLLATTTTELAVFRLIAGVGLGGCLPPAITLVSETLPARVRPLGISLCILANPLGIAAAGLFSATLMPIYGWQSMYIVFGALPFLVAAVAIFALPESPIFTARNPKKAEQAARLRARLNLPDEAPKPVGAAKEKIGIFALLQSGQATKTLSVFGAFFCIYLSLTFVLSWLPSLLTRGGFSPAIAGGALSVFSLAGAVATVLTGMMMTYFGTRRVGIGFFIGMISAVLILTFALPTQASAITNQATYIMFFAIIGLAGFMFNGTMTGLFAHASGVFAPSARGTGIGLATTCGRTGAIVGSFIGAQIIILLGTGAYFFAMCAAALAGFLLFLVTGTSYEENTAAQERAA